MGQNFVRDPLVPSDAVYLRRRTTGDVSNFFAFTITLGLDTHHMFIPNHKTENIIEKCVPYLQTLFKGLVQMIY